MPRIDSMHDVDGVEVTKGDFVQLLEDKGFNQSMKKGFVFKVAYIEDRPFGKKPYFLAFLTGKNGDGYRIYSNGVRPSEIRKVNYDLKKRKIIETITTQLEETK